ncbi:ABC transporter ATP-binding protein [Luminiphilus sp.]|nr:ABC transporter ATP-binding protein [Luminiphilus sp.]MDC3320493.1 ABC transporter ATP-binding protein [Luminiphilus sp.]
MNEIGVPLIQLSDVSLSFTSFSLFRRSSFQALSDVSFAVYPGETFGIVGRNGCGKSTLLQVLADIMAPDSGIISKRKNLKCALLTLGLGFNRELTGRDNAILSLMLQGASRGEAIERLQAIKEFSELDGFFDRPVRTYSSGMRSRLGFATALESNVDLLLIDETLSVGDKSFNKKAERALLEKMSGSQTVIFVSHNEKQVERLCERAIWLEKGEVAGEGEIQNVAVAYRTFVSGI